MNAAYAVLDLETSGFCAATDAILEIAVVHWSPGDQPRLAFETLIDSQGRFGLEELHGIRREDLHAAPTFGEIAKATAAERRQYADRYSQCARNTTSPRLDQTVTPSVSSAR